MIVRPGARLGPLSVPLQRRHLGNVHFFGQLGDVSLPERILRGFPERSGVVLRGDVLMFAALGLFLGRQGNGMGFGRGLEIAGPDPAFPSVRWRHGVPLKV